MSYDPAAAARLMTMIEGSWQTHVVATFAELGLADLLCGQPRPIAELAREAGANPGVFPRFIRACRKLGLVAEEPQGRVRLTEMGGLLSSAPASLRDFARVHATAGQLRPFELLAQAVRDGSPTTHAALGEPIWEYYGNRPEEADLLGSGIDGAAALEASAVLSAIDLTGCQTIVELRGGVTAILTAVLDAATRARGILVDSPEQLAASRRRIATHLLGRVDTRPAGSLVPPPDIKADVYLISHGIRFAGDDQARQALTAARSAGHPRTQLVITDPVLTDDGPAVYDLLDLHSLVLLGGRERTQADYDALLSAAGWRLQRSAPTSVLTTVQVAVPA